MSPQASNAFASAIRRLDQATAMLEEAADSGHVALVGLAYAEVLLAKGEFTAALQLVDLEETLRKGATDRAQHLPPQLKLVR